MPSWNLGECRRRLLAHLLQLESGEHAMVSTLAG
jgi:hypothetical protein